MRKIARPDIPEHLQYPWFRTGAEAYRTGHTLDSRPKSGGHNEMAWIRGWQYAENQRIWDVARKRKA